MSSPPTSSGSGSGSGSGLGGDNNNADWISFQTFFQGWLIRQQHYLDRLLSTQTNIQTKPQDELNALVSEILSHYQQYYQAKSIATHNDVFIMFAPPWFTSLEHTFLWIAGFKPCLAFKILTNSVGDDDLSGDQLQSMQRLRAETRAAERELSDELARVQESLAAPPLLDLARRRRRRRRRRNIGMIEEEEEEEMRNVEMALQSLREAMEGLVESADFIRMNTARKVVELLSPVQSVKFLAAATQLQIRIRMWGSQRDAERRRRRGRT